MKYLIFVIALTSSYSASGQKAYPKKVEYDKDRNLTKISFKRENDFIIKGEWHKYQETADKWKYYLKNDNSEQIGVGKFLPRRLDFYSKDMIIDEFLEAYMEMRKKEFNEEKCTYSFEFLNDNATDDYSFYYYKTIECSLQYGAINLVGVKRGIVYELTAFVEEGDESKMKNFLLDLYEMN